MIKRSLMFLLPSQAKWRCVIGYAISATICWLAGGFLATIAVGQYLSGRTMTPPDNDDDIVVEMLAMLALASPILAVAIYFTFISAKTACRSTTGVAAFPVKPAVKPGDPKP